MTLSKEYYTIYMAILFAVGVWILIRAYRKGVFFQALDVVAAIGIAYYSFTLCTDMATKLPLYTEKEEVMHTVNSILWFVICFVIFRILYYFIEFLLKKIFRRFKTLKLINRLLGVLVGLLKVCIIYAIVCLLCMLPFVGNGNDFINNTPLMYIKDFMISNRKVVGIDD